MKAFAVAVLALYLLVFVTTTSTTEAALLDCNTVMQDLSPCLSYLLSGNGPPSPACCSGVSQLVASASMTADKRSACGCLKSAAAQLQPNVQAAQALPGSCGIALPFPISQNVDCSQIH